MDKARKLVIDARYNPKPLSELFAMGHFRGECHDDDEWETESDEDPEQNTPTSAMSRESQRNMWESLIQCIPNSPFADLLKAQVRYIPYIHGILLYRGYIIKFLQEIIIISRGKILMV